MLHPHDFGPWVARGGRSRVVAAGDHGGRGDGDARVRHRHGRGPAHFLFGVVETHGGRVDGRGGMRRGLRSGPRVGKLRRVVMRHVVLIDVVEAHPAVLAVLVFNDHRHGGWMLLGWNSGKFLCLFMLGSAGVAAGCDCFRNDHKQRVGSEQDQTGDQGEDDRDGHQSTRVRRTC